MLALCALALLISRAIPPAAAPAPGTPDGELSEFRNGVRKMLDRSPVPVVPMALSELWPGVFARGRGKLRHAARPFPAVRLAVGEPVAAYAATPHGPREAVLALRGDRR